jgi:flagellar L-ring protein precursor FlgH
VRRQDIAPDNTVPSSKIAEAEIRMEGAGAIQERQRKGVITQLMDWLF